MVGAVQPEPIGISILLPDEPIYRPVRGGRRLEAAPLETTFQYMGRITLETVSKVIGTSCVFFEKIAAYFDGWLQFDPLPNAYEVHPLHLTVRQNYTPNLFRGGKPLPDGLKLLQKTGVRTVVNLKVTDGEGEHVRRLGMAYHHIPMNPNEPSDEDVLAFLRIMASPDKYPVYVHCNLGSDRTGFMIAAYRIVMQNVEKQEAIDEMVEGPYGFHSYLHWPLISYLKKMDPEQFVRQL